jgi:hypothetical protein
VSDGQARSIPKARHVPTIYPEVEPVCLSDFDIDDIVAYVKQEGHEVDDGEGVYMGSVDLARIETLVLCGQREQARAEVLDLVGEAIGRKL